MEINKTVEKPMTYIEKNFFSFPIRLYDVYSAINADIQEEKQLKEEGMITPGDVDWVEVVKVCRPEHIIGWSESGERGQDVKEISDGLRPITVVIVREGLATQSYECNWKRAKFEARLNEKMQAYIA